ncbi:MAG: tetratricopeptide repeat protein [Saprospiraceae bacterium]|nr:tetratricopeptide repeat protein [Saprospiraceae bacterium]
MSASAAIQGLLSEAWAKRRVEDYVGARSLVTQAEEMCAADDYASLGRIYHIYMQFESDHDNLEGAVGFCEQSVAYYQKTGIPGKMAHSTRHLADLKRELGWAEEAIQNYREAIGIYREQSDTSPGNMANALRGFGLALELVGEEEEAKAIWQETMELYQACGLQAGVDEALQHIDDLA